MPKLLKRKKPDVLIENKICCAAIVSDQFMKEFYSIYKPEYLQNPFAKRVCNWAFDYYELYKVSPKTHIADIFDIEKEEMDRSEIELIQALLENVNRNYMEEGINEQYILDQTIAYFKKRELQILNSNLEKLIEFNKIEKAEEAVLSYKKVIKAISGCYNPFENKYIDEVFDDMNQGIFSFPGQLGHFIGPIERGWLCGFIGPFKGGKSFWLQEVGFLALMDRLKVAWFSLEMNRKGVNTRLYKRITAYVEGGEQIIYPVFDCKKNQTGECDRFERKNEYTLVDDNGEKPEFSEELLYKPCIACRLNHPEEYELDTWYEAIKPEEFNARNVKKRVKAFYKMYSQNLRINCYPRFSAGISDIVRDLDLLEQVEGFIPDVIIIDYADILKPEGRKTKETEALDEIWKTLAALAAQRHTILWTASQGNRGSLSKKTMTEEDMAGWIGKLGHVDIFASINRTPEEKKAGVTRIGLLAHRHREFNLQDQCVVLNNYTIGQTHLDSEFDRNNI